MRKRDIQTEVEETYTEPSDIRKQEIIDQVGESFLENLRQIDINNFGIIGLVKLRKIHNGEEQYAIGCSVGGMMDTVGEMLAELVDMNPEVARSFHKAIMKRQMVMALDRKDPEEFGRLLVNLLNQKLGGSDNENTPK